MNQFAKKQEQRDDLRRTLCARMLGHADYYLGPITNKQIRDEVFIEQVMKDVMEYRDDVAKLENMEASCSQAQPSAN